MSILYLALPIALFLVAIAIAAFIWSVKKGQYDDLETPAVRMLFDDVPAKKEQSKPSDQPKKKI